MSASAKPVLRNRIIGALTATICISAMLALSLVAPNRSGYGTHKKLGLDNCDYLSRTGYPCPGCGFTTSITSAGRWDFIHSARSHIFGLFCYLLIVSSAIAGAYQAVTGRAVFAKLRPNFWWLFALVALFMGGWLLKTALGVWDGTFPIH